MTDYLIIGAGLGGLVSGAILSKEGASVKLFEKSASPGGLLQSFSFGGKKFDTGMHYAGALNSGNSLNRYFRYLDIEKHLDLHKLEVDGFDRIFANGRSYPLAMGFENFVEQLLPFFPGERAALVKYTETLQHISDLFPLYNLRAPDSGDHELKYRRTSAYHFLHSLTSNSKLRSVLAGNNFLYAGDKESTPLYQPALINHSYISGAYRFPKGSWQITDLLVARITSAGGSVICNKEVVSISKNKGIFEITTMDGERTEAKNVISGIHPSNTLALSDTSLFRPAFRQRILNLENTTSAFGVYAVLKDNSFPYMNYNCYLDPGGASSDNLKNDDVWPDGVFLQTPVTMDQTGFADRLEILTLMHGNEVPSGSREAYEAFKMSRADNLINLAERHFPGVRECIREYTVATPLTWERFTGSPGGSIYGIKKDYHQPVETMVFPRTKVPGFYFTGQNINLHGLPGTTIGAVMTCGEILGMDTLLKKIRDASE